MLDAKMGLNSCFALRILVAVSGGGRDVIQSLNHVNFICNVFIIFSIIMPGGGGNHLVPPPAPARCSVV